MILQALNSYYGRLADHGRGRIPPYGFSTANIHFALLLDTKGHLVKRPHDLRDTQGKKPIPKRIIVPREVVRTSGPRANFLWDKTAYVLGVDKKGKPKQCEKKFQLFADLQKELAGLCDDEGLQAVLRFLEEWNPTVAMSWDNWDDIADSNLVFRLENERNYIHKRPKVKAAWVEYYKGRDALDPAFCLVTGRRAPIRRLHNPIRGVWQAQTSGAGIVSFNDPAFCSYGHDINREKGTSILNAPVCSQAEFAYVTVLNHLLRRDSRQKVQIGDATTVFWAERASPVEGFLGMVFDPRDDGGDLKEVRLYLEAIRDGKTLPDIDNDVRFYILGLSPNASRLSVRFWHVSTVGDVGDRIGQHFKDLAIVRSFDTDPEFPSIWQLLRQTAVQGKTDNIPHVLAGEVMRSILTGAPYPRSLLSSIIIRIRADQTINYLRAAIIKACLVRQWRITKQGKEIGMVLDPQNADIAYVLGRLFAVLERAQKDAVPGANTTIKDRFFGAASSTPRTVFPQLMRLAQHHIDKAEFGHVRDKEIEQIMDKIVVFPAHLSLDDQGLFAIGYYHQRADFFKKVTDK